MITWRLRLIFFFFDALPSNVSHGVQECSSTIVLNTVEKRGADRN